MAQILNTGKQRAGKGSRITVGTGNTRLNHTKWSVNSKADDLDTVNFESLGLDEGIAGVLGCELAFGGAWDAGLNVLVDPPGLYPRDDLPSLRFYENVTDAQSWLFTYARLRSANNGAEVRGLVTFDCSGMSQGAFTSPTGQV